MKLVLETLDRLIGFDTVSARSNLSLIGFIEVFCRERGAETRRISGTTSDKYGLIARFGPDREDGILLSGHTDVVPAEGQNWTRPPFALTREGDRLFGRGTTDMKGFLACMLDAADTAARADLTRPLTLLFSYDEEIGCVGIQEMRSELEILLRPQRLCIVGEPTGMQVATGHKGKAALRARCTGQSGHSALAPHFVNALHLASDFVTGLRGVQAWFEENGARDAAYDVPYTTLHAGRMTGGTALNIVPDRAEVIFEYRYLPADGDAAVLSHIEKMADSIATSYAGQWDGAAIAIERMNAYPGLEIAADAQAVRLACDLSPVAGITKMAFGTEAGVISALGIPTVVCGPGSMAGQGHKPDEYIEISQLSACKAMLDRAVGTLT